MHHSTKKWLTIKFSSIILIPLMFWFIVNLASIYDESYTEIVIFFSKTSLIVKLKKEKAVSRNKEYRTFEEVLEKKLIISI